MFKDPDFRQLQDSLLRIVQDRKRWHNAQYALKNSEFSSLLPSEPKLHGDAFSWYSTLEKNIARYLDVVMVLERLDANLRSDEDENNQFFDSNMTPYKVKQLLIAKLVAEVGLTARELRNALKKPDNVGDAVRLRRRLRWLEMKLEILTRDPERILETPSMKDDYRVTSQSHSPTQPQDQSLSPAIVDNYSDGESLSSDEAIEFSGLSSSSKRLPQRDAKYSSDASEHPKDAADTYWNTEHHQVDHSPLTGLFGPSLPFHSLDIQRSDSYVKKRGQAEPVSLTWRNVEKEYLDPNSEEKALERLSVTVQEMMGRAYNAALESVPMEKLEESGIKKIGGKDGNDKFRRISFMRRMKGQKWMEKKYGKQSIHKKDTLTYYPPAMPEPPKLLLAKLSGEVYPPVPANHLESLQQRAIEMPPRFVNQHDLLKKTHLTLYELMFDAEKVKSKVDFRTSGRDIGYASNSEVLVAPSATLVRAAPEPGRRPTTPIIGTTITTKGKSKNMMQLSSEVDRLPPVANTPRSPVSHNDRIYMTKSGWGHTRKMPSPMAYITLRLERVKELMKILKDSSKPTEQRVACVKQIMSLGVTNSEVIGDLVALISSSSQRSLSMDVRCEVVKVLLLLGFTDDAVLKELLVFISSNNYHVICDLLRALRKALSSPRISQPFNKTSPGELAGPHGRGKNLNLLYVSPADCLLVHRLVQLCHCTSPELSFFAAVCLSKVKVMPPPPPLKPPSPPPPPPEETSSKWKKKTEEKKPSPEEEQAALQAAAEYNESLDKYEKLLEELNEQDRNSSALVEMTFRQIARSKTPIVVDALEELIGSLGSTDEELFKIAYDLIENSPIAGIRAAMIKLIADSFVRMTANGVVGTEYRISEFQEILIRRLCIDCNRLVWTECARTFYKLGLYDKMSESVLKNLDTKQEFEAKMQAIRCAVGLRIRGPRITRALVDLLELDSNDGVRVAACRALGEGGTTDRRALAALRDRYERTQGVIAREAGRALAALTTAAINQGNPAAFNPAFLDALVDRVVQSGA